jgi:hypothetical protein
MISATAMAQSADDSDAAGQHHQQHRCQPDYRATRQGEYRVFVTNGGLICYGPERRPEEIAPAFETLGGRAEALIVCGDPLVTNNRVRIITLQQRQIHSA